MILPVRYPAAIWKPLLNHSSLGQLSFRKMIVLHSTEGTTAQSAINTFAQSVFPNRVSAHFVIDRDGTVYQLVDCNDTAWHASAVNSISIGIEHVALSQAGADWYNQANATKPGWVRMVPLLATNEQYTASSKLVTWLCAQMHIPCDSNHVKPHSVASPRDQHTGCCTATLDPAKVISLAQGWQSLPANGD